METIICWLLILLLLIATITVMVSNKPKRKLIDSTESNEINRV